MKKVVHPADSRGHANHGWLESFHSFSFANYYNPDRMQFGTLRVLNDDRVAPGMGFGTHPHQNMEIVSIPLSGDLEHKDSMGNIAVIREGDIQVMSAGTGVRHSEYNKNKDREVAFLQIWVLPNRPNVSPRYDQVTLDPSQLQHRWHAVLGPEGKGAEMWLHQDAWFHLGAFPKDSQTTYKMKDPEHGLYIFILNGAAEVAGEQLVRRDALGLWEIDQVSFTFSADSKALLMEVPMSN